MSFLAALPVYSLPEESAGLVNKLCREKKMSLPEETDRHRERERDRKRERPKCTESLIDQRQGRH